jgi:glycosyltransferase involved in cell wall biosynthesis
MADNRPIITICIPTYNRGDILLNNMEQYVHLLDEKWPLLILDNASHHTKTEYEKIAALAEGNQNISYIRKPVNTGLIGNIISAFELAETTFLLFVSDEDIPNIEFIANNYDFFKSNIDIGCIRTSTQCDTDGDEALNAYICDDEELSPGIQAIAKFAVNGNYLSGSIYNKDLLTSSGIFQALQDNKLSQAVYPHMYLNMKCAAKHKTRTTSEISVFLGKANSAEYDECLQEVSGYFGVYAFGSRLDQFISFRDALLECTKDLGNNNFDPEVFYVAYLDIVTKFMQLITLTDYVGYLRHGLALNSLTQSFCHFAIAAVRHFPMYEQIETALIDDIIKIEQHFLDYSDKICNPLLNHEYYKQNFIPKIIA